MAKPLSNQLYGHALRPFSLSLSLFSLWLCLSLSACLTLSFALWTRACVYVCVCVRLCVLCVFVCVCINGVYINAPASRCFSDSDALLSRVCVYMLYTQDVVSRVASGSSLFLLHGRAFKVAMCLLHQLYEVE